MKIIWINFKAHNTIHFKKAKNNKQNIPITNLNANFPNKIKFPKRNKNTNDFPLVYTPKTGEKGHAHESQATVSGPGASQHVAFTPSPSSPLQPAYITWIIRRVDLKQVTAICKKKTKKQRKRKHCNIENK